MQDSFFVEPPGFEPGSKQMPNELSTCVFRYWISAKEQETNQPTFCLATLISLRRRSTASAIPILFDLDGGCS
jgi:hypothetical protein